MFTTTTGDTDADLLAACERAVAAGVMEVVYFEHEPHCYVCHRHSDHFAEHDSLVGLGLAEYRSNGDVAPTEFSRTSNGELVRYWYDAAIGIALQSRGVSLIKPEGYAVTRAFEWGFTLPGRSAL